MRIPLSSQIVGLSMLFTSIQGGTHLGVLYAQVQDIVTGNPRAQSSWMTEVADCITGQTLHDKVYADPYDPLRNVLRVICPH